MAKSTPVPTLQLTGEAGIGPDRSADLSLLGQLHAESPSCRALGREQVVEQHPTGDEVVISSVLAFPHPDVVGEAMLESSVPQDLAAEEHRGAGNTQVDASVRSVCAPHTRMPFSSQANGGRFPRSDHVAPLSVGGQV